VVGASGAPPAREGPRSIRMGAAGRPSAARSAGSISRMLRRRPALMSEHTRCMRPSRSLPPRHRPCLGSACRGGWAAWGAAPTWRAVADGGEGRHVAVEGHGLHPLGGAGGARGEVEAWDLAAGGRRGAARRRARRGALGGRWGLARGWRPGRGLALGRGGRCELLGWRGRALGRGGRCELLGWRRRLCGSRHCRQLGSLLRRCAACRGGCERDQRAAGLGCGGQGSRG
jgi:hypothetical protein